MNSPESMLEAIKAAKKFSHAFHVSTTVTSTTTGWVIEYVPTMTMVPTEYAGFKVIAKAQAHA